ncbi:MAG: FtsB family cell division protein [Acidithiobacillales bacterium]
MRFTKVVGPPGGRPRIVGIRRLPGRYADRQNVRRSEEPPEEPERAPAARPEPSAVKPASYFLLSLVFSALLLALFFVGDRGFLQIRRQRTQLRSAQDEVAKLDAENRKLEAEVAALKNDPHALEKIAREKLGLVRPGEVVVVLPEGWEQRVKPRTANPGLEGGPSKP